MNDTLYVLDVSAFEALAGRFSVTNSNFVVGVSNLLSRGRLAYSEPTHDECVALIEDTHLAAWLRGVSPTLLASMNVPFGKQQQTIAQCPEILEEDSTDIYEHAASTVVLAKYLDETRTRDEVVVVTNEDNLVLMAARAKVSDVCSSLGIRWIGPEEFATTCES